MSERFFIGFADRTSKEKILQVKKIIERDLETTVANCENDGLYFSCFLMETSNVWRSKLDRIGFPKDVYFRVVYPDESGFEYIPS